MQSQLLTLNLRIYQHQSSKFLTIPLNIGFKDQNDNLVIIFHKGTVVPAKVSMNFACSKEKAVFSIYEGGEKTASQNKPLARFVVENLLPNNGEITLNSTINLTGVMIFTVTQQSKILGSLKIEGSNDQRQTIKQNL